MDIQQRPPRYFFQPLTKRIVRLAHRVQAVACSLPDGDLRAEVAAASVVDDHALGRRFVTRSTHVILHEFAIEHGIALV